MKNMVFTKRLNKKAFLEGFTSFSLFQPEEKLPERNEKDAWARVWQNFSVVNDNFEKILYEQTTETN